MRRVFCTLFCVVFLLMLRIHANAHPGNTDSRGGHYNRSTGEYHYHHGYSEHQHTDMDGDGVLDCPYEFDDRTSHHFNIPQYTIDRSLLEFPDIKEPTYPEYVSKIVESNGNGSINSDNKSSVIEESFSNNGNLKKSIPGWIIYLSVFEFFMLAGLIFAYIARGNYIDRLNRNHASDIEDLKESFSKEIKSMNQGIEDLKILNEKIATAKATLDALKKQTVIERQELERTFLEIEKAHIDRERIRKAPIDISFAKDGYPIYWEPNPRKPHGDFTVFYNKKANIFHTDICCAPYFAIETHLFKVVQDAKPCKKCAKKYEHYQIPMWYQKPEK